MGHPLHQVFDPARIQAQVAQHATGYSPLFTDQAQEQMLGTDVVVLHPLGFILGQTQHTAGALSKTLHAILGHSVFSVPSSCLLPATPGHSSLNTRNPGHAMLSSNIPTGGVEPFTLPHPFDQHHK